MSAQDKSVARKPTADVPARIERTLSMDEDVTRVKLVSPTRARALAQLDIKTVRDLVTHFPRRYVDMSQVQTVATARIGDMCTISGTVYKIQLKRPRRVPLVEITLTDATGTLMVTMFRQPWLMDKVKAGDSIAVAGKLEFNFGFKCMVNPHLEVLEPGEVSDGMIIPVHPASGKVSAAMMRRFVSNSLDCVRGVLDPIPLELRLKYRLMSKGSALECIHFPKSMDEQFQARRRLVFEELLLLQIALMSDGASRSRGKKAFAHIVDGPCMRSLSDAIPFTLTDEQEQAKSEILGVLSASKTANHMLLGDVGTGKTIVSAYALAAVADTKTQAAFLAPTEILARQHANSLGPILDEANITWDVLTGSTVAEDRAQIIERVSSGDTCVLFGTHAILEDTVKFANMSLAVIDEQQRFGVDQRSALLAKGDNPDALYLTATPIPRTLALALFGNLTLSYIKHRPHDSQNRITKVHPKTLKGEAYDAALAALKRGEQVYVVCPLVGDKKLVEKNRNQNGSKEEVLEDEYDRICIESDDDLDTLDVAAAQTEARFLQSKTFVDFKVDLLHGKMSGAQKQEVMARFSKNESQVLVATTVIEVGVDVPNATVMIVEDADRFGLAQLHQLRGRVGRGEARGEVHLISSSKSEKAISRLKAMETTDDGFELSSFDLSLRREGDILGNRQHGASGLKLVNIMRDKEIIEEAHNRAFEILEQDPELALPEHRALAREARIVFKDAYDVQGG